MANTPTKGQDGKGLKRGGFPDKMHRDSQVFLVSRGQRQATSLSWILDRRCGLSGCMVLVGRERLERWFQVQVLLRRGFE